MASKKCEKTSSNSSQGGFIEVPIDPEFPKGWKKKVYEMNGRLVPRWTIWFDDQGNKFVNEKKVRARLAEMKDNITATEINLQNEVKNASVETIRSDSRSEDLKIVYNARGPLVNLTCDICSLDFACKEEFNVHSNLHKSRPKHSDLSSVVGQTGSDENKGKDRLGDVPSIFRCLHCGKISTNKWDHKKHELVHSKLQPHSCDICYQRFSQNSNLQRHRRNKHPGEFFSAQNVERGLTPVKKEPLGVEEYFRTMKPQEKKEIFSSKQYLVKPEKNRS